MTALGSSAPSHEEIQHWLRDAGPQEAQELFQAADAVRKAVVGDAVHLRGLIEVSNVCCRKCTYCGLRAGNSKIARYRLSADQVVTAALQAQDFGYGTVVLQAGEDPGIEGEWMAEVVRRIKAQTSLAVTLSLGERSEVDLRLWRKAGADRYFLRFETSDPRLFEAIHPPDRGERHAPGHRLSLLPRLQQLGYETGSGVMVGLPGQTWDSLAQDIGWFRQLDLEMIGVGPYIANLDTPLGRGEGPAKAAAKQQVPAGDAFTTLKVVALTRLSIPGANLPTSTALNLSTADKSPSHGLSCGANVIMPDLTPQPYRERYRIYPGKGESPLTAQEADTHLKALLASMGRSVGVGPGRSRAAG